MRNLILMAKILFIISCSRTGKTNKIEVIEPEFTVTANLDAPHNYCFEVEIDVVVKKDDIFHVFYKDLNDKDYSADRVVEQKIKGMENSQIVVFSIPEGIIPTGLRLDFGMNYVQSSIKLNTFIIRQERNELYFDEEMFIQLFKPNKHTMYDKQSKLISSRPIEGKYDPNFTSIDLHNITFSLIDRIIP